MRYKHYHLKHSFCGCLMAKSKLRYYEFKDLDCSGMDVYVTAAGYVECNKCGATADKYPTLHWALEGVMAAGYTLDQLRESIESKQNERPKPKTTSRTLY